MAKDDSKVPIGHGWYDLFSRGARDWLRHNDKIREAVRNGLPDLIAESGVLSGSGGRTVQVPVRFLEHYRFRLSSPESQTGVGQGEGEPGDVLRQADRPGPGAGKKGAGHGDGGLEFVIELKVDEIVDWLWEELALPNLKPKYGTTQEDEYLRTGWDKRGARARLDRRRTMKEAIKRRHVQADGPLFTDDDLRYRQLVKKPRPTTDAVLLLALDVSSSMTEQDRKLAKTFFFWVLQGLRRQYRRIETAFVAHTVEAWEFAEEEFFQVSAHGGTVASRAFRKVTDIVAERFDPGRYNVYLFYASDGENAPHDRDTSLNLLRELGEQASFLGYVETTQVDPMPLGSETGTIFRRLAEEGLPAGAYSLHREPDVWDAIRAFFTRQAED
jgi:uncharacterized sporulation protein YeaH/YhbH (DUF444 family)